MNLLETIGSISLAQQAILDAATSVNAWLPEGLICSATVDTAILAAVLLGVIRLVTPYSSKGLAFHRNQREHP